MSVTFYAVRCLILRLPLHSIWKGRRLMMLWVNVITHFYVVVFILFLFTILILCLFLGLLSFTLEKKKIASLLKMPFLDEESPSNPYSRKVNGLSCSLIIFVFYFISVFFPKVKNLWSFVLDYLIPLRCWMPGSVITCGKLLSGLNNLEQMMSDLDCGEFAFKLSIY